ncbi:50S ribosomal protein L15 [Firmicutes bacterium CAG:313]|nr:50S ribosomal protein L15 [Firmicutes bacterium CAG:313]
MVDEAVLAEDKALMEELQREQVSAIEVKDIVSDEVTKHLIEKEEDAEKIYGNKKAIINLDVISRSFEANDVVTVNTLKEKHLIAKNVYFVKVLARGVIDKPLVIKAQDFSIDAAKMIQLTGGKVVMLTKRKYF